MASVSVDGRGILVNERHVWLVSGTVDYSRIPRAHWRSRISRALDLGLNCIEVPVVWSMHEPREGVFDMEGEHDLGAFVSEVGAMGMHCVLRLGPFIGDEWSMGGIPVWAADACGWRVRRADSAFLPLVTGYWRRVGEKIGSLCAPKGGPIIGVQIEHHWMCGDDEEADAYLGELRRVARESGFNVPMISANNLFTDQDSMIEAWSGYAGLHAAVRQLGMLGADTPALVAHLPLGCPDVWGSERVSQKTAAHAVRRLIEVASAGGQFNISPVGGGTHTALAGRRFAGSAPGYPTTDHASSQTISQSGAPGETYHAVRRVCHFLRSFGRVLASAEGASGACVSVDDAIAPITDEASGARASSGSGQIVAVERRGAAGSVVFVLGDDTRLAKNKATRIVMSDGTALTVSFGKMPCAWILQNVRLESGDMLDYCSLSAFAQSGRTLVCFGPGGTHGMISLNGTSAEVVVPKGRDPMIEQIDNTNVVVCNEDQIDSVLVRNGRVYIGADSLGEAGTPVESKRGAGVVCIDSEGSCDDCESVAKPPKPKSATIQGWSLASAKSYIDGSNPRFATIDGATALHRLGAHEGYGWYRVRVKQTSAAKKTVMAAEGGDRIHVYAGGSFAGTLGDGAGAGQTVQVPLKKGETVLAALADDMGRGVWGRELRRDKGLCGDLFETKLLKATSPKLTHGAPISPLDVDMPIMGIDRSDTTVPERVTWTFTHRKQTPVIVDVGDAVGLCVVVVNDEPIAVLGGERTERLLLDKGTLKRGANTVQLAVLTDAQSALQSAKKSVRILEGVNAVTGKAAWSFAAWEMPDESVYEALTLGAKQPSAAARAQNGTACWWRGLFDVTRTGPALHLDMSGMSRGVIYVNGWCAGRYWVATHDGKRVPPQARYYLPGAWLDADRPNELVIFDEHGFAPNKIQLVYE